MGKTTAKKSGIIEINNFFIENESEFYRKITELYKASDNTNWYYLMAMETIIFEPYFSFNEEDEKAKIWKKIKLEKDYMLNVFVNMQTVVDKPFIKRARNTYNNAIKKLDDQLLHKVIIPVGLTAIITVATGGLAAAFAPGIAVGLVGSHFVGLYGQALINASLAYLGGGALAVGGAGMAGGTMLITGGASILGIASGSAVSGIASAIIDTTPELILRECAKLITSSTIILLELKHEEHLVEHLCGQINKRREHLEHQVAILKAQLKTSDKERKKELKKNIDTMQQSNEYLKKTGKILEAKINSQNKNKKK